MCRGKWGSESRRQWENNSHEEKSELGGIDKTEKPFQSRVAFWPREENSVGLRWDLGGTTGMFAKDRGLLWREWRIRSFVTR